MRNSVIFKFIALLLCAASLLGVVGAGAGILVLTETGLYNKTAEAFYQENLQMFAEMRAYALARRYADRTLGGCTDGMFDHDGSLSTSAPFVDDRFGYVLLDGEGNELERKDLVTDEEVTKLTFPVTGQYMYLVKLSSPSQNRAEEAQQLISASRGSVQLDMIRPEGCEIFGIDIRTLGGASYFSNSAESFVFRNEEGKVVLLCPDWVVDEAVSTQGIVISSLALWDQTGELVYMAEEDGGIGTLRSTENGSNLIFESYILREEVPEETVPAETVLAETVPEESYEELPLVVATEEAMTATAPAAEEDAAAEETAEQAAAETTAQETAEETAAAETEAQEEPAEAAEGAEEAQSATEAQEVSAEESTQETTEATQPETVPETTEATVPMTEPTVPEETVPEETLPPVTEPVMINGKRLDEYQINRTTYYDHALQEEVTAKYVYLPMPKMTVEFSVAPNALEDSSLYTVLAMVRSLRSYLLPVLGICLLIMAATGVYLCCSAGRRPKSDEVRAGALNRIPIDLYLLLAGGCIALGIIGAMEGGYYLLRKDILTGCAFVTAIAFLSCLLIVGFLFALVAQIKTPGGFWWRNSLVGWSLKLLKWLWKQFLRLCIWLEEKLSTTVLPALRRLTRWCWGQIRRFFQLLSQGFNRAYSLLPVTWQWLLMGIGIVLVLFVAVEARSEGLMVLWFCLSFAIVLYGAHCFGSLMEATRKMNKGNLDTKVDDKLMAGAFKTFAGELNDLGGVAVVAAQKQLKSERMKTELITNVSHDIKTPLTSIINYVDLLQKPHTEQEQEQYLEVLDRQSQRLKKLIDDLIDMSKASTGNMAVDITLVDAVESVNQALGEFADKLERAQLYPVFRHTEESVAMMADGRLVWRVLSNLLGNAVKYAMPGTRLYIDLMSLDNKVVISLKNISRDELNVDAEELMERFVRGDDARNTEGSGLGLNIAKSLMELQKGQLQLLVDGDLFKVTLIFPGL